MRDGTIPGSVGDEAAVYRSGHITLLGHYAGFPNNTVATSVNDYGNAVGYASSNPNNLGSPSQALYFSHGHITVLNGPSNYYPPETINAADSINDNDQIVGTCMNYIAANMGDTPDGCEYHLNASAQDIGGVDFVSNITNHGQYAPTYDLYNGIGIFWQYPALRTFGGGASKNLFAARYDANGMLLPNSAAWLNEYGDIVGSTTPVGTFTTKAYVIKSGQIFVTNVANNCSAATGINDSEQVVLDGCNGLPYLWSGSQGYDLNSLLTGPSLGLKSAVGIDDRGDILAKSSGRAYLLTPLKSRSGK